MLFISIIILAFSLLFLVLASEKIITSAVRLSNLTGFSEFAIGTVVIAIGTSLPELVISILSMFEKSSELSIGLLLGSSIADMTIVFGIVCFSAFILSKKEVGVVETVSLSSLLVVFALILGTIDLAFGIFSIILFSMFIMIILKKHYTIKDGKKPWILTPEIVTQSAILIISIITIVISARFVVSSATELALYFNTPSLLIGAVIIGLGTVLPETAVSIMAIKKRNISLAIGNVAGSVVVNIALIMGMVSIAMPLALDSVTKMIMYAFLAISILFIGMAIHRKYGRLQGILLIATYVAFVVMMIWVGMNTSMIYS